MKLSAGFRGIRLTLCLLPYLAVGCGGDSDTRTRSEVEGTVTVDGEPVTEGSVAFYMPDTGETGGGKLGADGKFKLDAPVPVGKYKVSFQPPPPPQPDDEASGELANVPSIIPERYRSEQSTDVTAEVKDGPNAFTFALTKEGPIGGSTPP